MVIDAVTDKLFSVEYSTKQKLKPELCLRQKIQQ